MPRTITGLDVREDFSCEVLDLAQKITIMGETPSSKKFLAYKPDNDTTVYQDIDVVDDIDINSLSSLTTPDNASDQLLICDADGLMNKKITPGNLFTPKAVTGTAPVVSSDPTGPLRPEFLRKYHGSVACAPAICTLSSRQRWPKSVLAQGALSL
jgi:hypothetical protein